MKDPCIRQLLRETELSEFIHDGHSRVVEELTIPTTNSRIDIAVINGAMHGYEIKSASDNLDKIEHQIAGYSKVFDFISIVTEGKHYGRVLDFVPQWVGLFVCSNENGIQAIKIERKAEPNIHKTGFNLAMLLWNNELIDVLSTYKIQHRKNYRSWLLCEALSSELDTDAISDIVRTKLKERENWRT